MEDKKLSKAVSIADIKNFVWFGSIIVAIMLTWSSVTGKLDTLIEQYREVKEVVSEMEIRQSRDHDSITKIKAVLGINGEFNSSDDSANLK